MANTNTNPEVRFAGFTEDWVEKKAKELCSISTGKSNTQDNIKNGIYPFYVRSPIIERSNKFLFDEEAVLTVGDGVGTGKVHHYVNGKYDLHQRVYRMFDFKEVTGKYFYLFFSNNFHARVTAMTAKSSVDSVRLDMIAEMNIKYPKIGEQKLIGNFFENIDNLITEHQQKHTKLKSLKQAMLDKMFPQKGQHVPEIRFKGFEGNWKKTDLGGFAKITMGQSPNGINYTNNPNDAILVQGNADMKNGKVVPRVWTKQITKTADFGDIIFSVRAPVGEVGRTYFNVVIGRGVAAIKGDVFLYQTLKKMNDDDFWKKLSAGSTFDSINSSELSNAEILVPSEEEQILIGSYFKNIDELIDKHISQMTKLQNIKKALLAKMFI